MSNRASLLFFILIFVIGACRQDTPKAPYSIQKTSIAEKAMVVSAHPAATEVGLAILKKGGNAVDAAIAVQFALAVVYPVAGNIGGGGFMVYRGNDGDIASLDFREKAPLEANRDMYLDSLGKVIPRLSIDGHLAAGVPGTVEGMFKAHLRYGSFEMRELIEPARLLAAEGFQITARQADNLNNAQDAFRRNNRFEPVFINADGWQEGDLLIQPELAATLQRIQEKGRDGFYTGTTAELIVAEMEAGGGIISLEDLANYQAVWRTPLHMPYKEYQIISMPPSSSGGIALLQLMKMAEDYPLAKFGFHSPEAIHFMVEAERRVYADRAEYLGDSDFYPVPVDSLLDTRYILERISDFDSKEANTSKEISAGNFAVLKESEQTTHFSIVDTAGNAVSITTTINTGYGSKTVVKGAGFILNNEMDDFSAKPGVPNFFGLVGNEANAIAPGKRMLSSMTPSIVTKNKELVMVVGSPGGSTIITSVFQTILNVIEFGMDMPEAVTASRFHHQWLPDLIQVEKNALSEETKQALRAKGHKFKERETIGRVDAILVLPDGKLQGAADPRGDDHALGM